MDPAWGSHGGEDVSVGIRNNTLPPSSFHTALQPRVPNIDNTDSVPGWCHRVYLECITDVYEILSDFVLKMETVRVSETLETQPVSTRFHHQETGTTLVLNWRLSLKRSTTERLSSLFKKGGKK
jgi:hypothetical protein